MSKRHTHSPEFKARVDIKAISDNCIVLKHLESSSRGKGRTRFRVKLKVDYSTD